MPHRGRLNFMTSMLDLPAKYLFMKVLGRTHIPAGLKGTDDVISHVGMYPKTGGARCHSHYLASKNTQK